MSRREPNLEQVLLTLRAEGPGPPPAIRLRRALKCLLRSFGLRCVSIEESRPAPKSGAA